MQPHRRGGGGAGPADRVRGHVGPAVPADGVPGQPHADDHHLRRGRPLHGHPGRHAAPRPLLHQGRAERRRGDRDRDRRGRPAVRATSTRSAATSGSERPPLRVIGIYQKPDNIFEPPGQQIGGVMPFETAHQNYHYDETNNLFIAVRPRPGQDPGDGAATWPPSRSAGSRNLRPGMPNTFDLITQDQILDVVGKFTTYFFLAMVVALERGAPGGRHRRDGHHDGLGDRPDPRDRPPEGARRHPAGDPVAVPGRGRDADAGRGGWWESCSAWARAS